MSNRSEFMPIKAAQVVYLGIGGVLHPSRDTFFGRNGIHFEEDGHKRFESLPVLVDMLSDLQDAKIVVTSTMPYEYGPEQTTRWLKELGPRVIGNTFEDLTRKAPYYTKSRKPRDEMDYWRMCKSRIVSAHVKWLKPKSWIVIDDEDIAWDDDVRENQLVLTNSLCGLAEVEAQIRLAEVIVKNFL